jgi:hypothetical protein
MRHKQEALPTAEPALLKQEIVDKLLIDTVKTICEEQAAKQDIVEPFIGSVALESFAAAVDECNIRLLEEDSRKLTSM